MNKGRYIKKITPEILEYYSNKSALLRCCNDDCVDSLYHEIYDLVADTPEYVVFEELGKFGVKNSFLDFIIVPAIYDKIEFLGIDCGLYTMFVVWNNGKAGIVKGDARNTNVLPLIYDSIEPFETVFDYAKITIGNKCGITRLYDDGVKIMVEPLFDEINLSYPFFLLGNSGKRGLVGNGFVLPAIYDDIFIPEHLGWIKVLQGKLWGYIDIKGNFTTDIERAYLYKKTI